MDKRIITVFLCLSLLVGCYDKVEIDDWSYVITIGIDKANKDVYEDIKEDDRFVVCLAIPEPSTGDGEKKKAVKISSGKTVTEAINEINAKSSRKMYFGHAKVVALGEGVLSDSKLLKEALDYLERNEEISMSLYVLYAKGNIFDILNSTAEGEPMVAKFITNFYKNNKNSVEVAFKKDLEGIIRDLYKTGDSAIPSLVLKDDNISLNGSSVIGDYCYRGELSDEDTRGFLISQGKASGTIITVEKDGTPIPFKISHCKNNITFSVENGRLISTNSIKVSGSIEENIMGGDSLFDDKTISELEASLREEISSKLKSVYNKLQKDYHVDTAGLMTKLKKDYYNIYKLYEKDLSLAYENMEIVFNVDATIKGIGVIQ